VGPARRSLNRLVIDKESQIQRAAHGGNASESCGSVVHLAEAAWRGANRHARRTKAGAKSDNIASGKSAVVRNRAASRHFQPGLADRLIADSF
jgi:hypothetical protein